MSDKSAQKKSLIIEKARQVFKEKGYKEVTMKDIVEACSLSVPSSLLSLPQQSSPPSAP